MSQINLGIIGGGQLGSMLSVAAKKLDIKTIIFCDDNDAPAQNFCDHFIFGIQVKETVLNVIISKKKLKRHSKLYSCPLILFCQLAAD